MLTTHTVTTEATPPSEPMYWTAACTCGLIGTSAISPGEARYACDAKHPYESSATPAAFSRYHSGRDGVTHDEAVAWCPTHQTVHLGCEYGGDA